MKKEIRETYRCDFCKKIYFREDFAIRHERMCPKNPINDRPCFDCKFLTKEDTLAILHDYTGEPICESKTMFYCLKKRMFVYPPEVEAKGNSFQEFVEGEIKNIPMPRECDDCKTIEIKL